MYIKIAHKIDRTENQYMSVNNQPIEFHCHASRPVVLRRFMLKWRPIVTCFRRNLEQCDAAPAPVGGAGGHAPLDKIWPPAKGPARVGVGVM